MADENFYKRVTRIFRSGPAIRQKVRGLDTQTNQFTPQVAAQNDLGIYNGFSYKREQSNLAMLGAYGVYDRLSKYKIFNEMEYTTEISTALDLYADEACSGDENGRCLHVHSDNPNIQRALEILFYEVANIDFEMRQWVRNLVKYGDCFLYVECLPTTGVSKVEAIPVNEVEREELYDLNDPDAVRFKILSRGGRYLANWQVLHFRVKGNDLFYPYGTSFLEHARRVWSQLIMIEDAMLVYRLVRSPERRVFYIDVSGVPPSEVANHMEQVKQSMRSNMALDRSNGHMDQRYQPMAVDDDYFLPTRPNSQTKIDTLAGGTHVSAIEDVEYIQKKLTGALKVPRAYLGFEEGLSSKATLSQEDIRFSRTITSLQDIIKAELNFLAMLHLYAVGFDGEDLKDFELKLSNPSTVAIQQKLNLWSMKFEIAGKAKESGLVDEEWIQKELLGLRMDTIIQVRIGRERDQIRNKTLEALEPPNPEDNIDDGSITDPFDPSQYQVPGSPVAGAQGALPGQQTAGTGQSLPGASKGVLGAAMSGVGRRINMVGSAGRGQAPIKANATPNLDRANRRFSRIERNGPTALASPDFTQMLNSTKAEDIYDTEFYKSEAAEPRRRYNGRIPVGLNNNTVKKLLTFESAYKRDMTVVDIEFINESGRRSSDDDDDDDKLLNLEELLELA